MPDIKETIHITGTTPTCDSPMTESVPRREVRVGDTVAWAEVPDGAMVRLVVAWSRRPEHAIRAAGRGEWVWDAHPFGVDISWPWTWDDAPESVTIIALGLTGSESAADLQRMAEVFDIRQADIAQGGRLGPSFAHYEGVLARAVDDRSKPPPGASLAPLPAHLRRTVETAGVWGPAALAAAWAHHDARAATRAYEQARIHVSDGHGGLRPETLPEFTARISRENGATSGQRARAAKEGT